MKQYTIGTRINSWTILGATYRVKEACGKYKYVIPCQCACGSEARALPMAYIRTYKHCKECTTHSSNGYPIHKQGNTSLYRIWSGMLGRCERPSTESYKYYGARGITVCNEWRGSFIPFMQWALANGYTEGLSIERIDNDKNYEPDNCKWIPLTEQGKNRRNNRNYTLDGVTKNIYEWSKDARCEVYHTTLWKRVVRQGMPLLEAFRARRR